MGRRRVTGRNVEGILLLDKPVGQTSNAALQQVKRLFFARKAGHTGSLDPLADGLLPICFGSSTKISAFLLDADKRYWVRARLGETTTTGDAEGETLVRRPVESILETRVASALHRFKGEIQQVPPMYSALKHKGERLYKLARDGIEVEREPRTITIYGITLLNCVLPDIEFDVRCSKGTYVRTLAEDIGEVLGCGAHVTALRRTGVGPFGTEGIVAMKTLDAASTQGHQALDRLLLPADSALTDLPEIRLSSDSSFYLKQGQAVLVPNAPTSGRVRLYGSHAQFLGVGEILDDGRVAPKRFI
ncbi:MAG: tRNA pseudouridine(55) synthase TruB [Gammaproteobacteria bacterium]|nr:tRNA pseudouridine(55) synthase TruB [Gammaproteobacteria bacterium]